METNETYNILLKESKIYGKSEVLLDKCTTNKYDIFPTIVKYSCSSEFKDYKKKVADNKQPFSFMNIYINGEWVGTMNNSGSIRIEARSIEKFV